MYHIFTVILVTSMSMLQNPGMVKRKASSFSMIEKLIA